MFALHVVVSALFKKSSRERGVVWCLKQLFSIVVFGCISSQGWWNGRCQYNNDPNACGFGVTIGVISFLGLLCFLIADGLFDNISSVQTRKYVVLADIAFSGKHDKQVTANKNKRKDSCLCCPHVPIPLKL